MLTIGIWKRRNPLADADTSTAVPHVYYYRCDLRDFQAITSTAAALKNRLGNPTVLINNAGIGE